MWRMAFGNNAQICQILSPQMWHNVIGEIEWQNFCLARKGWLNPTPDFPVTLSNFVVYVARICLVQERKFITL